MKKTAVVAGIMVSFGILIAAPRANAESFFHAEVGLGGSLYQTEDGRWYQQGMPVSSVSNKNIAFSLGFTGPVYTGGLWGLDWHADYVNLGRVAASCLCTSDDNYNSKTHTVSVKNPVAPAYFTGSGRSQGAVLSLEPYYWTHGVRLGFEAGAYIHHDAWDENVYGWTGVPSDTPRDLGNIGSRFWAVSPVIGASIGNGKYSLAIRHYFTHQSSIKAQARNIAPPLWNDINTVELKVKF